MFIYILTKIQYDCQKSKMAAVKIWTLIILSIFVIGKCSWCQILGLKGQGMYFCIFKLYTTYICKDVKNIHFYASLKTIV